MPDVGTATARALQEAMTTDKGRSAAILIP
jgi:hypothetical protein